MPAVSRLDVLLEEGAGFAGEFVDPAEVFLDQWRGLLAVLAAHFEGAAADFDEREGVHALETLYRFCRA